MLAKTMADVKVIDDSDASDDYYADCLEEIEGVKEGSKTTSDDGDEKTKEERFGFACSECDKAFNTEAQLTNHVIRVHEKSEAVGEDPPKSTSASERKKWMGHSKEFKRLTRELIIYKCNVCDMDLQDSQTLLAHLQEDHDIYVANSESANITSHSYICRKCDGTFGLLTSVYRHLRNVHKMTNVRLWSGPKRSESKKERVKRVCSECGKVYNKPSHLEYQFAGDEQANWYSRWLGSHAWSSSSLGW